MSETKREARSLSDINDLPDATLTKIERLGNKIADLSSLLADYEDLKKSYMAQLAELTPDIDYSVRGTTWTYEEVAGRLYLSEQKLLEYLPISKINECKIRSEPYRQVRRDREKKEKM